MSETTVVIVRPRRSLLVTAFVAIALAMIPIFGVLYWFSFEHQSWVAVFIVHLVLIAFCVLLLVRQLTVYSAVTRTELVGRGIFSPLIRVPLTDIAQVDLVETYIGQSPDPVTQLLVRGADGRRLFRMRGNFYKPGDLPAIADALPVKATVTSEPTSLPDFFRAFPGSAYWFEHRPILWIVLSVVALVGALAIATWVMTIVGMPIGFEG